VTGSSIVPTDLPTERSAEDTAPSEDTIELEDAIEIESLATEPAGDPAGGSGADESPESGFRVRLANFEGPFDLLLSLITRRQLDITEVALSQVTDEFLSYLAGAARWDLGQATEFLVVAATLLDLKTARLLPAAEVDDEEDLALLEARDLLFARLLQYRAYKLAAAYLGELERAQGRRYGRDVDLEPRFAALLPEVVIGLSAQRFADLAAAAMAPRPVPTVSVDHVHAPKVSVREQMAILRNRLRRAGSSTFRSLVADCASTLEVVGRFLALLELYRDGVLAFDQAAALAELRVRWTGSEDGPEPGDATEDESVDEEYG
jgi:segregation and condensation protein A